MEYLCKITPVGSDVTYFLLTTVREMKAIVISMTDGQSAWEGNVKYQDCYTLAAQAQIPEEDIWRETVKALTRQDMGSLVFEYQLQTTGSKAKLTWKKLVAAEDVKFQLGSAKLQQSEDPHSTICKIIEFSLKSVNDLSSKITNLTAENERLTTERANALKRLEKCVAAKEAMETDLYSKFVVVVNDKKGKIRKLQEKINDLQDGARSSKIYKASDEKPKRRRLSSSAESDSPDQQSDYETDEEKPSTSSTQRKGKSKAKTSKNADDSLMLDDGHEEEENTVISRRKRRQSSMKKTPSKPVIPKVSSTTPDTRSSARKPPMRKKTSNASSNKSSDDIEAEDLIDDLA